MKTVTKTALITLISFVEYLLECDDIKAVEVLREVGHRLRDTGQAALWEQRILDSDAQRQKT